MPSSRTARFAQRTVSVNITFFNSNIPQIQSTSEVSQYIVISRYLVFLTHYPKFWFGKIFADLIRNYKTTKFHIA
jgi:hypothetical protein